MLKTRIKIQIELFIIIYTHLLELKIILFIYCMLFYKDIKLLYWKIRKNIINYNFLLQIIIFLQHLAV